MFTISDTVFKSRLLIGTGKFSTIEVMLKSISAAKSELVTLAIRRVNLQNHNYKKDIFLSSLRQTGIRLLPNTSGAQNAHEALFVARLAKEIFETNWIKLEIHPDVRYLLPDPIETLLAAEKMVKEGFVVLPYCSSDPILCRRLEEVGCAAIMPLGAPIGSNKGLWTRDFLKIIIEQSTIPIIIDAGIGYPSQALEAMEIGADAVLINTAIATSTDPITMANSFRLAVQAGEYSRKSRISTITNIATPTSPLTKFLSEL